MQTVNIHGYLWNKNVQMHSTIHTQNNRAQVNFRFRLRQILVTFEMSNLATSIWVRGWGNVAIGKARVRESPTELGKGMLILSGKVSLGKVWLSYNRKSCQDVQLFSHKSWLVPKTEGSNHNFSYFRNLKWCLHLSDCHFNNNNNQKFRFALSFSFSSWVHLTFCRFAISHSWYVNESRKIVFFI